MPLRPWRFTASLAYQLCSRPLGLCCPLLTKAGLRALPARSLWGKPYPHDRLCIRTASGLPRRKNDHKRAHQDWATPEGRALHSGSLLHKTTDHSDQEQRDWDEERCLLLGDALASSVWEGMKGDVNLAWPRFQSVYQRLNETPMRERHDFRSVQICLLTTYAMKLPVLIATSVEKGKEVVFLAFSASSSYVSQPEYDDSHLAAVRGDLVRRLKPYSRLVLCGKGEVGDEIAGRLASTFTCNHAPKIKVKHVSLGPASSILGKKPLIKKAFSSHPDMAPGKNQLCTLCGEMCGEFQTSAAKTQISSCDAKVLKQAFDYVCVSVSKRQKQLQRLTDHSTARATDFEALLESEGIFRLLQRCADLTTPSRKTVSGTKLRQLTVSLLLEKGSRRSAAERIDLMLTHIKEELMSPILLKPKRWTRQLLQDNREHLLASVVLVCGAFMALRAGTQDAIATAIDSLPQAMKSELKNSFGTAKVAKGTIGKLSTLSAQLRHLNTSVSDELASKSLYAFFKTGILDFLPYLMVASAIILVPRLYRKRAKASMSWAERDEQYWNTLRQLLGLKLEADSRWYSLSTAQLEALLIKKFPEDIKGFYFIETGIPQWFSEITNTSQHQAIHRVCGIRTMHQLHQSFSRMCHIAVIGPRNSEKSKLLKNIWEEVVVSGKLNYTDVEVHPVADKVKVLNFPSSMAMSSKTHEELRHLIGKIGILLFVAELDDEPNAELIRLYTNAERLADKAAILVCLTQASHLWKGHHRNSDRTSQTNAVRLKWAAALSCSADDIILIELESQSPDTDICGVEKIQEWLKERLVRMNVYEEDDEELALAVRLQSVKKN